MGKHRIICSNAFEETTYRCLLEDQVADLVFCDPPYNVPIDGHVSGLGKVRHREFEIASGEMSEEQFIAFLENSFKQLAQFSKNGAIKGTRS